MSKRVTFRNLMLLCIQIFFLSLSYKSFASISALSLQQDTTKTQAAGFIVRDENDFPVQGATVTNVTASSTATTDSKGAVALAANFKDIISVSIGTTLIRTFQAKGITTQLLVVSSRNPLVMKQKPDIIFFTGDLVNDRATETEPFINILSRVKAPMGVFSTLGNHDYGDYTTWESADAKEKNLNDLKNIHAQLGWKLMMNEHIALKKGEDEIALIGIENWGGNFNFPKYGNMKKAYAGTEKYPVKLLLSHDPSHWNKQVISEYKDVDITFSGHTHGFQFGIEIPGFRWSPSQYVYKQWAGLYKENNQYLYVNRGLGFLGYPGRVGILPEITVMELSNV